ncbi:uncharacterized protein LOC135687467 [Rhopilema esculentum]|uniref:uncharacterized protein LOC135687467 n=1 Tax=Rhopilema esculentum TaxID=499914 RepID=UPI0031D5D77F|eukprot:gene2881-1118_t
MNEKVIWLFNIVLFVRSQFLDDFQRSLCRERWKRMDWQQILRPCKENLEFGSSKWKDSLRTSPSYSHVLNMDIKKAGEFSKIAIQSRTAEGREKSIGGDVWRVFISGPSNIAPFVSDLENGVYEATFLAMEPGFYKAKIYLESTLCEGLKDPPREVLKRGIKRDGTETQYSKGRVWRPIRGDGASFKVEANDKMDKREIQKRLNRWKDSCGANYKCDLLWNGFGRWVNKTWKPYIEDLKIPGSEEQEIFGKECIRKTSGKMMMYGDNFAKSFFDSQSTASLFNNIFENVTMSYNGDLSSRGDIAAASKDFSIKAELKKLQEITRRSEMDERSVLLLNYGLPYLERMPFGAYKKMMDRVARTLDGYKGQAVWRTTASFQKQTPDAVKAFESFQRTKLFNAYTLAKMCSEGYPAVDISDMTASTPNQPSDASGFDFSVVKPMEKALKGYFQTRTSKKCEREKVFKKVKVEANVDLKSQMDSESGSGSGGGAYENEGIKQVNASSTYTQQSVH